MICNGGIMIPEKNKKHRVLIVDDSSFMRMAIRSILNRDPEIEIVGTAINGAEGVAKALALKPDLITMDVEMPVMDGISALKEIMSTQPTRVIMVSTLTKEGATATFDALESGAVDYVSKSTADSGVEHNHFREELLLKIKTATATSFARKNAAVSPCTRKQSIETCRHRPLSMKSEFVGIGASTGGPVAIQEVLSRLPATFNQAIIVVIHMPKAFTGPFSERLNNKCALPVKEAADGDLLLPGHVLVAPGGRHMTLQRKGGGIVVQTVPVENFPKYVYVPSIDLMMTSLSDACKGPMVGVILTGMGNDGLSGMRHIKEKGGMTLVQDKATSTIYGMPKACVEAGIADAVLPLDQIGAELGRIATG
jgi:two-component system, chemotaxis family, protein-glutamate methylesterase/glutaminase